MKRKLNCKGLRKIKNLPHNIKEFQCWSNKITKIENLPNNLQRFECNFNRITKIENLPYSLQIFYCCYNQIRKIENLPLGLQEFYYGSNNIEWVDNVEYSRINFTLRGYQAIRRIQLRMKRRFKIKNNASTIIGRQALHWLHSPNGPMMLKNMKMLIENGYLI